MRLFLFALPCLLLCGCTSEDSANLSIDLSRLNWQTIGLILLALAVDPGRIVSGLTQRLASIPFAETALRLFGLIKSVDTSPQSLTQAEVLEALVSITNRMPASPLRDKIAELLTPVAKNVAEVSDAK